MLVSSRSRPPPINSTRHPRAIVTRGNGHDLADTCSSFSAPRPILPVRDMHVTSSAVVDEELDEEMADRVAMVEWSMALTARLLLRHRGPGAHRPALEARLRRIVVQWKCGGIDAHALLLSWQQKTLDARRGATRAGFGRLRLSCRVRARARLARLADRPRASEVDLIILRRGLRRMRSTSDARGRRWISSYCGVACDGCATPAQRLLARPQQPVRRSRAPFARMNSL